MMEEANQLLRDAALTRKVALEVEFDVAGERDLHCIPAPRPCAASTRGATGVAEGLKFLKLPPHEAQAADPGRQFW